MADAVGLADLVDLVDAAVRELDALRSTDPAAGEAVLAVRLARHTLTSFWLPALAFDGEPS